MLRTPKIFFLWIILWISGSAEAKAELLSNPPARLVVTIVVDQLRSDYLTKYGSLLLPAKQGSKPGGFRYLTDNGAYFKNAQTGHAINITGLGHAAVATGAPPSLHGIIAHRWFEESLGDAVYCMEDQSSPLVHTSELPAKLSELGRGRSPKNLQVSTFADELKNATAGRAKVAGVSLKDRSAILLGGHRADLALWYEELAQAWITSKYYVEKTPLWLQEWNKYDYLEKRVPQTWTKLLPEKAYSLSYTLEPQMIGKTLGLGEQFPHPIQKKLVPFLISPWGNAYILDTALEVTKNLGLGKDAAPDFLGVSLSSFDALGHRFDPNSPQMLDAFVRLDRMLADFFAKLDALVPGGIENVVFVLTADHGVSPAPIFSKAQRLPGDWYSDVEGLSLANKAMRAKLDLGENENPVVFWGETHLFLNRPLLAKKKVDLDHASRLLAKWLRSQPFVVEAYAKTDVLEGRTQGTEISQKLARTTHTQRSGDGVFAARPGFLQVPQASTGGTEHENPTVQDSSIPIVFKGKPFRKLQSWDRITLSEIAPTLSAAFGIIAPSGAEGKVLGQALK
ncbi:MAG: alkaline phosphatase family protein [Bdellovibrionota bacterium]